MATEAKAKARSRAPSKSGRPWAAALAGLLRAYGPTRRVDNRAKLDLVMLAVLVGENGERAAVRWVDSLSRRFVDWNEMRVACDRDLAAAAHDVPADRLAKLQALLQSMYEVAGSLDVSTLAAMKPSEARAWLGRLEILGREEVEAALLIALSVPTLPASGSMVRVARRLGLVPRKATAAQTQKLAAGGLAASDYRRFYGLVGEHAAARCREAEPDCPRCAVKRLCKSRGRW